MTKKLKVLIVLLSLVTVITGCWDKMEIKELVIAVGMGIDKVDDNYLVSVQVVNPNEIGANSKGGGGAPVTVYKETGKTIFEAIRKLTTMTPKKIYFSHLRIFVIGEETARSEGIGKIIEFISRDHELRADYDIIIAKNMNATLVMESLSEIEKIPAKNLYSTLQLSSKDWASSSTVKIDDVINELMTEGDSLVVTGVVLKGDASKISGKENFEKASPSARLEYDGLAVFKQDKLINWLEKDESKGYNYVLNKVKGTVGTIGCPNETGRLSIEVLNSESEIRANRANNKPHIQIKIMARGNVDEVQCEIDLADPEVIKQLEKSISDEIEGFVHQVLQKERSISTDFLGLGASIHRSEPRLWKTIKQGWTDQLRSLQVDVEVDFKIRETGKTKNSFLDKIKE
ncbi:Ger(x)C family spore germination protein [Paenibacillus sp. Marseille-Q4541]|uniref:Ger(x)C family spore germination protein n=1 Tax=Paenibacillus sp. Marseille-Q4541 TaxID=2831522 RepID=UPI001BAAE417|nr:Ger(x)C family spore germination protein [Paenibacillus sp. Marseille-Q4541]